MTPVRRSSPKLRVGFAKSSISANSDFNRATFSLWPAERPLMHRTFSTPPETSVANSVIPKTGRQRRQMKRRATYYRGYRIEGKHDNHSWHLRIGPRRADLPIMRFASFRVMRPT